MSKIQGFKYMVITVLKGLAVWVVSLAIGTSATDLISFYDTYNTKIEASHCDDDGTNCTQDTDGTALTIDLFYHELASWGAVVLMGAIIYLGDSFWLDQFTLMAPK